MPFEMVKYNTIDGFFLPNETFMCYQLAKQSLHGIVEIGSFKGKSTYALAQGSMDGHGVRVYAIDPFDSSSVDLKRVMDKKDNKSLYGRDTFLEFLRNMEQSGVKKVVFPVRKKSVDAVGDVDLEKYDLLFIDGSHEYDDVCRDFLLYKDRLVNGGVVVFHDYGDKTNPDVKRAVDEFYVEWNLKCFAQVDLSWFGVKLE